jgi:hypothetical protein
VFNEKKDDDDGGGDEEERARREREMILSRKESNIVSVYERRMRSIPNRLAHLNETCDGVFYTFTSFLYF